ncbi:D-alanyl-lipoteichoic acid acyltransferase DltB, MBOAT superfamily [Lachnospiraceae bacterium XBB2008]|nr:D-alanyl-lipoteichoic acid acyltransferase DltB, MBOAT superfamily [Lachnospiraceae bacterium XBB2008]
MNIFTLTFLIFLIAVFLVYRLIDARYRYIWLLVSCMAYYAYMCPGGIFVLLYIIAVSYLTARLMMRKNRTLYFVTGLTAVIAPLIIFKAIGLFFESKLEVVGSSFFILVAAGYIIDVYRGVSEAEKNPARYALFISFFPTISSGPIERSTGLLKQIRNDGPFDEELARKGINRILRGLFMKCLIADRAGTIVNAAYGNIEGSSGLTLLLAALLYSIQLYADFAGYSNIAIGIGNLFGFEIAENFRQPFFATDTTEFWRRWHITLGGWFKEYFFYPLLRTPVHSFVQKMLTGVFGHGDDTRKAKKRAKKVSTYIAMFALWFTVGMWHGISLNYLIGPGLLQWVYIILEETFSDPFGKLWQKLKVDSEGKVIKCLRRIRTFLLFSAAMVFFRSASVTSALTVFKRIFTNPDLAGTIANRAFPGPMSLWRFVLLLAEIIILFAYDTLKERGGSLSDMLAKRSRITVWCFYLLICIVIITGLIYNSGSDPSTFIYARF